MQCCGQMLDAMMTYLCVRCGRISTITSLEFAMLPEMQESEIRAASCDISWTDDMQAQLVPPEPLPPVKIPKPLDPNRKSSLPVPVDAPVDVPVEKPKKARRKPAAKPAAPRPSARRRPTRRRTP